MTITNKRITKKIWITVGLIMGGYLTAGYANPTHYRLGLLKNHGATNQHTHYCPKPS